MMNIKEFKMKNVSFTASSLEELYEKIEKL